MFILRASLDHVKRIRVQAAASIYNSRTEGISEYDSKAVEGLRKRKTEAARQRKATRIVAAVVGSFILLVVPIVIIDIVEMLSGASC